MYYTTLNKIRYYNPCEDGWKKLLSYLDKTKADDEPLSLLTILESNGLEDAVWCLRAVDNCDKDARLFAVWCARQVEHLFTDWRSVAAVNVAERYAHGQASRMELDAAWDAAGAAAWDAAWGAAWGAAWDAAKDAAKDAAGAAAWDAAWGAAWDAAWGAAWDAARDAAWGAAWDAARATQTQKFKEMFYQ